MVNGNPSGTTSGLNKYLFDLTLALNDDGHSVQGVTLRDMKIRYCTGCFGCWVKKPGECVVRDDSAQMCRKIINSDFTLFASPLIMGFPSTLLKKANDKLIPLVHPYISFIQGECHHVARYDHYPWLGLLLEKESDTDQEDLNIVTESYSRLALNFKSTLVFSKTTETTVREVSNEINRI
jgi:multimeric flavodoxin WrbA